MYDNGSAFSDERQPVTGDVERAAACGARSCYLDGNGHPLEPLKYISSTADANCTNSLLRFVERLDLIAVDGLIDSLPEEFLNFTVMPAASKAFYKEVLHRRFETCLLPAAEAVIAARHAPSR